MKLKIFISIIVTLLSCNAGAQNQDVKKTFDAMYLRPTNMPYYFSYRSVFDGRHTYAFPTEQLKNSLDTRLWEDLQLTKSIENDFLREYLLLVFTPTNGSYRLGVLDTGAGDLSKLLLVTAKPDGTIIDNLEVGIRCYHSGTNKYITVKQFEVDNNMRVTVYQIRPTSTTPILFDSSGGGNTFTGQRIDMIYQIDSNGKFQKIQEIKYVPKTYNYSYLEEGTYIFKDGSETKQ